MAEITMTLQEFATFQKARTDAENEAAVLRQAVADARLADPDMARLVVGMRAAREVMPFALMFVPRTQWPTAALRSFADVYEHMPGAGADDQSIAMDLRSFAQEVDDDLALRRRTREAADAVVAARGPRAEASGDS